MTGPTKATRALVWERDNGRCVACGKPAEELQHVRCRGMGGSRNPAINSPANLVWLCRPCHRLAEARVELMNVGGYWKYSWQKPGPVYYATEGAWYVLGDDGTRTRTQAPARSA